MVGTRGIPAVIPFALGLIVGLALAAHRPTPARAARPQPFPIPPRQPERRISA